MTAEQLVRGEQVHEGKAKIVYRTQWPDRYLVYFKDDATAFDGKKKGQIIDKGRANNLISAHLFQVAAAAGIPTHFIRVVGPREMLVRAVTIVPVEVVVRNIAAGSLAKRLGLEEGLQLDEPLLEYYYKCDDLGDPLINEGHIRILKAAAPGEVAEMGRLAAQINDVLRPFMAGRGLTLVDFKLEFGRIDGDLILADEISPDTCRLWDARSGERLDKDRFRRDLGKVEEAYLEVLRRIVGDDAANGGAARE